MPQEHYVMTIQSIWNGEPKEAHTVSGVIETNGLSARQVYEQIHGQAVEDWRDCYYNISMGEVAVLLYHRELNTPR